MVNIERGGRAAVAGGVLWALVPVAFSVASLEDADRGTASFVAVAASYWLVGVLALLLLLTALAGLRPALAEDTGRLGTAGITTCGLGLVAMVVGNATELLTLTVHDAESDVGHAAFLLGFLVLVVGSLLLGIALLRRRPVPGIRWAAILLAGLLPAGIGIAVLGGIVAPDGDGGFWAAITLPTGTAWFLLGRFLPPVHAGTAPEFSPAS